MSTSSFEDKGMPGARSLPFLSGGGEMGALVRAYDWAGTHMGPPEEWPQSLKTAVSICLGSRYPIVIWWGRSTYTQFYNDAYISFLGTGKHPWALGRSGRECWSEIWPVIGPMIDGVLHTGEPTWSEDLLLVLDRQLPREEAYFTFSYSPIRTDDGAIGGIFCACYETTGRVIGERRLKTLGDLGPLGVEGNAEEACEAAAQVLDQNPEDIPFCLIYLLDKDRKRARLTATTGLLPGDGAAPWQIPLGQIALEKQEDAEATWPLGQVLDSGAAVLVLNAVDRFGALPGGRWQESPEKVMAVPIPGPVSPTGVLISGISPRLEFDEDYRSFLDLIAGHIGSSITNAEAHEEERERAAALAEIDRAKTAFFANVSHEFRTPLTLMLGPLEEALASGDLAPDRREQLDAVHRNALRVLKLVNALLDFSRIESGRARAKYEATDLAAYTAELASTFRSLCERAGLRLIIDCEALPEPVFVDPDMWEKIVFNLLSNAFKYTFQGEVVVRVRAASGRARLSIRDTGVGIPEDELPHIFDRFHRVPTQRGRSFEGSGIGLALVQELVKLHGGEVSVQTADNSGTTFFIYVPFGSTHLPRESVREEVRHPPGDGRRDAYFEEATSWLAKDGVGDGRPESCPREGGEQPRYGGHILLADDNADMRDYVRRVLGSSCEVETVGDGATALEVIRKRRPDLVLTDVMMPGLDGFGLLHGIRADPALSDLPVIMLSARAGEESRVEGLAAGADDYLVKPFSARELVARVERNVQLSRLRRQAADDSRAMALLQEIGGRCVRSGKEFEARLDDILDAAITITGAAKGIIRLLDQPSRTLRITAQRGFLEPIAAFFSAIEGDSFAARDATAAGDAGMPYPQRVVVEDISQNTALLDVRTLEVLQENGIHALQATPLISSTGTVLGAISTHFTVPYRPDQRELLFLDILARLAADYIEREQAGEATRLLAAIVESSDDAIVSKDLNGIIQSWNHGAERLFGYTPQEVIGQSITIIVPPERSEEEPEILSKIRRGERIDHFETVRQRKNGDLRDIWLTISPVRDRHGDIVGASKIARDITERRRAERIQSEQRPLLEAIATGKPLEECLRGVVAAVHRLQPRANAGVMLADHTRTRIERCITVDIPASFGEGICGVPINEELIGACSTAIFAGEEVTCSDIAADERWSLEWRKLCANHGIAAVRSTPIFGSEGKAIGSLFICFAAPHDPDEWDLRVAEFGAHVATVVIQRQEARQALEYRTAQFESLFGAAPVGFCLVDAVGHIREVNPMARPVFAEIPDLVGRDFKDVMAAVWPEQTAAEIIRQVDKTLQTGEAHAPPEPVVLRRETGATEYYEWQVDRLVLPDGQYGALCCLRDVTSQVAAGKAIVESEARLRHIIDSAEEYAIVSVDGEGRICSWNTGAERLLGYSESEALGLSGSIFYTPEDVAAGIPEQEMTIARDEGRATSERWHVRKDGSRFWGSGVMRPLASGEPDMFLKIFRDGTERRRAERRQQLLINELNHRVKNTLATVQSIVRQTFRGGNSAKDAQAALDARLLALARCHDLLTRDHWEGTSLEALLQEALEPFVPTSEGSERFSIKGERVRLSPEASLSLSMGIHELATNAMKYGSLSIPGGSVCLRWTIETCKGERVVRLVWEEHDGPAVVAPKRKGFGSRLIERALAFEMEGSAQLEYAKSGVRCEVRIPYPKRQHPPHTERQSSPRLPAGGRGARGEAAL